MTPFILDTRLSIEPEYGAVIKDFISTRKPTTVVEIGTGQGYSTAWILKGMSKAKRGTVYTFDTVDRSPYAWEAEGIPAKRVRVFRGEFSTMGKVIPASVDFVFHDAGHWFEHVQADLGLVMPRMKVGGMILVHDIIYSFEMGEKLKAWFETKPGWNYREMKDGCGLGVAEKIA